jgi:hypothetical protein
LGGREGGLRRSPGVERVRTLDHVSVWLVLSAILVGLVIAWVGLTALRATSGGGPGPRREIEDVEGLEVFLVCRECGTEFQVTRLGELQVPRHCGEPMVVVQRPAAGTG